MSEEIDRWVKYMKENPTTWKSKHTKFINAQYEKTYSFIKRVLKTKNGKEKIIKLYNIKNIDGYKNLLNIK